MTAGVLVGYCVRCGADEFDGVRHQCPPKTILVDDVIALKTALARLRARMEKRPLWPPSMTPLYDDILGAVAGMEGALKKLERGS